MSCKNMVSEMGKSRLVKLMFICLVCVSVNAFAITLDAVWDGSSDGDGDNVNWSDPLNWDIDAVPANLGAVKFNVTIPAGKTVTYDVTGDSEIDGFTLGDSGSSDAQLILSTGCNLEVLITADIFDLINGNGGDFTSVADSDSLDGNRNRVYAQNGSVITINDPYFDSSGLSGTYAIILSDGAGSVLNLPVTISLNDGFSVSNYSRTHTIQASNDGQINLSGLTNLIGPTSDEYLNVNVNTGGSIYLDVLTDISHAGGNGRVRFNIDNTALDLPSLLVMSSTEIHVANGASFNANSSSFTYSATGLNGSYTLLSSDGAGSILNLSGMISLDDGFSVSNYSRTHTIQASNDGQINLSGLTNLIGPTSDEKLNININTGGSINLDVLTDISHAGSYGFTRFYLSDATLSLPLLSTVDFTIFTLDNFTLNLPSLTTVSSTLFDLANNSQVNANSSSFTYSATAL